MRTIISPTESGLRLRRRLHVVVGGGGVASLETALALRDLAGDRIALTLVSPRADFVLTPLSVGAPFAAAAVPRWPLADVAEELGAAHVAAAIDHVDPRAHRVYLSDGTALEYQALVLGLGARRRPAFSHAHTFSAEISPAVLSSIVGDLEQGWSKRLAVVVPPTVSWTLPAYEIALLTARDVRAMGIDDVAITIVTAEERPLALFGPAAATRAGKLLGDAGVTTECSARVEAVSGGSVWLADQRRLRADHVVALPVHEGRRVSGLPHDAGGFLAIDEHARVRGVDDVFAAGDGTSFPVKQGGIGTQQADAAAEQLAARAGADVVPEPFRPVLRGYLLTGEKPLYLVNSIAGGGGAGTASTRPLWSPPTKIAGRYLGPWLAAHAEPVPSPAVAVASGG